MNSIGYDLLSLLTLIPSENAFVVVIKKRVED
jgi:hypothetical protein